VIHCRFKSYAKKIDEERSSVVQIFFLFYNFDVKFVLFLFSLSLWRMNRRKGIDQELLEDQLLVAKKTFQE